MNITRAAIEKNRITFTLLFVVLAAGIGSYFTLPRSEDPDFTVRAAKVITFFPGASPERVEQLLTDKLEKRIQEIPEINFIRSESGTGISDITVNVKEEFTEMRPIWDDLRRKVDAARSDLPDGIVGPIVNDEFGDVFGINMSLTGDGFSYAELEDVAEDVRDELLRIEEVAKVDIFGAQEERIFVEFSNARLAEFGLSPVQLRQILERRNIIIPGGFINTEKEKITLEPTGNFESVDDLRKTIIDVPGFAELVYLEDLTTIYRGYIDPPEKIVHVTGTPGLVLSISLREGGNIIDLGQAVDSVITYMQSVYPIGIEFGVVTFQPEVVSDKIQEFTGSIGQAVAIVLVVMLLFLGFRTGMVVASLIPSAMIMALLVMNFFDIGLNRLSLASLIIALGMLVDNAIVMSESIMVSMEEGKKRLQAAVESANELRLPLLTSSLTTAAAFLPIYLAESTTGEYTADLFKVVTITLLCSWILSLTVIPLLCVKFLKVKRERSDGYNTKFYKWYRRMLVAGVKHRGLTVLATLVIFACALFLFGFVPVQFFPPSDRPLMTGKLELPAGTRLAETRRIITTLEQYLIDSLKFQPDDERGLTTWGAFIGHSAPKFALSYIPEKKSPDYAHMIINGTDRAAIDDAIPRIEQFCLVQFPDLKAEFLPLDLGPPVTNPVEVRISGSDIPTLFEIVDSVKAALKEIPGTRNIDDDWGPQSKKLLVEIDQARARRAGVTSQDIAVSLQANLAGMETTEYREGDKIIPVMLRSQAADRQDVGKIESMNVFSQVTGRSVPLKQVADVEVVWQPAEIIRRNRMRTVMVSSGVDPGVTPASVTAELQPWLEKQKGSWPISYFWEFGGEKESSEKANQSIMEKLPIAAFIITILLVGQFNSFRRTAIILLTIPLGIVGVVAGLLIADSYFGFMTLLGIISLAGIVINNAIVLIDRIRIEQEEGGRSPQDAIIESGQRRLRPILLTTMTTMGGLLPLWFGGDPMFIPMAIAIIFGLAFATMLTLGFVPVLYSLLFRISFKEYKAH